MDYHQYSPQSVHTQRDESMFLDRVRVFDRNCKVVLQCERGVNEADTMFAVIRARLDRIELCVQFNDAHTICI